MTWADEDFIGRISRISRRTHVLTAPARSIDRALGHYRRQWSEMFGPSYLDHLDLVPEDPAWKWAAVGIAVGVVCCRHLNSSACWWFGHLYGLWSEACIQSYLKYKSLSLHELARAWAKRMQRGALQVQGICRMRLSSFVTHIWAISETGDSRKGHQQIWQGPIAYQRENNVCAHVQHNLQRAHCYLGRSRRLPFTKFVSWFGQFVEIPWNTTTSFESLTHGVV